MIKKDSLGSWIRTLQAIHCHKKVDNNKIRKLLTIRMYNKDRLICLKFHNFTRTERIPWEVTTMPTDIDEKKRSPKIKKRWKTLKKRDTNNKN